MRKAQARGSFGELAGKDNRGHPFPQQRGSKSTDASSDTCKFQNRKENYHWNQYLSFYALAYGASVSLSLLYGSNLRPFPYIVFKIKNSALTSPGRESCPPTAAETSGKQQPMLPAVFFRMLLVTEPCCQDLAFPWSFNVQSGISLGFTSQHSEVLPVFCIKYCTLLAVTLPVSP